MMMNSVTCNSKFRDLRSGTTFFWQKEIDGEANATERLAAASHRQLTTNR